MSNLLYVNWNYTNVCSFNCAHCYSRAPSYAAEASTSEYLKIADKLINAPVFGVGFGGGEPTERGDFIEVLRHFANGGVYTHFTTHGWHIDEERAQQYADAQVGRVTVSLDGWNAESHDRMRRRPGSFARVLRAVAALKTASVETWLSISISKASADRIDDMLALAETLGVAGVNLKVIRPAGNALLANDICPDEEQVARVSKASKDYAGNMRITMYGTEGEGGCSCGKTTITIRPNGEAVFCPYSNLRLGNAIHDELDELLDQAQRHAGVCHGKAESEWPLGKPDTKESTLQKYVVLYQRLDGRQLSRSLPEP